MISNEIDCLFVFLHFEKTCACDDLSTRFFHFFLDFFTHKIFAPSLHDTIVMIEVNKKKLQAVGFGFDLDADQWNICAWVLFRLFVVFALRPFFLSLFNDCWALPSSVK